MLVCKIIQGFWLGTVHISRLNYDVISLIPKVKGADLILQFRPIALINNFAKFPAKRLASRLSPIAHCAISPFQSAFIKGRFILDGILVLHEVIHEVKRRHLKEFFSRLTFTSLTTPFISPSFGKFGLGRASIHIGSPG